MFQPNSVEPSSWEAEIGPAQSEPPAMKRVHISRVMSCVGREEIMSAPNTEMWALLDAAAAGSMSNCGMK